MPLSVWGISLFWQRNWNQQASTALRSRGGRDASLWQRQGSGEHLCNPVYRQNCASWIFHTSTMLTHTNILYVISAFHGKNEHIPHKDGAFSPFLPYLTPKSPSFSTAGIKSSPYFITGIPLFPLAPASASC